MSVMLGGAHDPEAVHLDDAAILKTVLRDLDTIMNVRVQPYFQQIVRHPHGIPQYQMDHPRMTELIETRRQCYPGLWLTGWSLAGISINACVEEAPQIAEAQ